MNPMEGHRACSKTSLFCAVRGSANDRFKGSDDYIRTKVGGIIEETEDDGSDSVTILV